MLLVAEAKGIAVKRAADARADEMAALLGERLDRAEVEADLEGHPTAVVFGAFVGEELVVTGTDDGMITFNQSLFNLVKDGKVSEKEALAKASNPQALEMNFKGIFLNEGGRIVG